MTRTLCLLLFLLARFPAGAQEETPVAVQTWTFHRYTFLESLDKADSLGIRMVEVYPGQKIGAGFTGHFTYTMDRESRDRLRQLLKGKNIRVIALGVIDKYYYDRSNLEQFFAFAGYMGIPFITAEPEWEDLDLFNSLAARYQVKVGLHCHPRPSSHYWHPDSTRIAMNGRPYIGAWPDIGHWARNGIPVMDGLRLVQDKLWGMHIKDVETSGTAAAADVRFGKGVCELPAVLSWLKKRGRGTVLSMEYESNEYGNMPDMFYNKSFLDTHLGR